MTLKDFFCRNLHSALNISFNGQAFLVFYQWKNKWKKARKKVDKTFANVFSACPSFCRRSDVNISWQKKHFRVPLIAAFWNGTEKRRLCRADGGVYFVGWRGAFWHLSSAKSSLSGLAKASLSQYPLPFCLVVLLHKLGLLSRKGDQFGGGGIRGLCSL